MSRNVDLTKPLSKQSKDDLRYALDWNLIRDPEDRRRAFAFLDGNPDAVDANDAADDAEVTEESGYDPADHNVDDVVSYCEDDDVSAEQVEAIIEMERAGKNRKSLIEKLEDMLEPEAEEA